MLMKKTRMEGAHEDPYSISGRNGYFFETRFGVSVTVSFVARIPNPFHKHHHDHPQEEET